MPYSVATTSRFDQAIDRLRRIAGPACDGYIADHGCRCIDDALQLQRIYPDARILNIGGRPYLFEYITRELGLQVTTLDLAPERNPFEIADLGLTVMPLDIERAEDRAQLDLSPYDVICMAEIFEHLRIDLVGTMRFFARAMRPDARLYLTTPNFYFAPTLLRTLAQGRSGPSLVQEWNKLGAVGHMGHVREYSSADLNEFFAFCGLEVERLEMRNSRQIDVRGGGWVQLPVRWLARFAANRFDRFAQELVFTLKPAGQASDAADLPISSK